MRSVMFCRHMGQDLTDALHATHIHTCPQGRSSLSVALGVLMQTTQSSLRHSRSSRWAPGQQLVTVIMIAVVLVA
jgi:hypothetical protein